VKRLLHTYRRLCHKHMAIKPIPQSAGVTTHARRGLARNRGVTCWTVPDRASSLVESADFRPSPCAADCCVCSQRAKKGQRPEVLHTDGADRILVKHKQLEPLNGMLRRTGGLLPSRDNIRRPLPERALARPPASCSLRARPASAP
jgi:hypothetical protein